MMKRKFLLPACFFAAFLFSAETKAQGRIGYFSGDKTLKLFPDAKKVDSMIQAYREDSIGPAYQKRTQAFFTLDSLYKKDCKTAIAGKSCEEVKKELDDQQAVLANWLNISQRMEEIKTGELWYPYRKQLYDTLQQVMKEGNYTLVLATESLYQGIPAPLLDNLSLRVAMKLHLPLPKWIWDDWKKAEAKAKAATKPAGTKPATPAKKK